MTKVMSTNKRSGSKINLRSPLQSTGLNTPTSTSSLRVSPSDSTEALSSTAPLVETLGKLSMRSPSMPSFFGSSSQGHPPADLHNKSQAETLHRSKMDTINSVMRTFSASKAFNQVLGIRDSEPFITPPAMTSDLGESFETGLQGYEQLYAAGAFAPRQTDSFTASVPSQQGQVALADILEEKESSVRVITTQEHTPRANGKRVINIPKWTSERQAVAITQRYSFLESDNDEANDTASQQTYYESDEDHSSWTFGSSTTLAVSDYSRPGSAKRGLSLPPPSFPPRTSSLLPLPGLHRSGTSASPLPRAVDDKLRPGSRLISTRHVAPATRQPSSREACSYSRVEPSSLEISKSLSVLLPSVGVVSAPGETVYRETFYRYASRYVNPDDTLDDNTLQFSRNTVSHHAPRITIQAPSPVKPVTSRKRALSSAIEEDFVLPLAQRSCRDETSGLPTLSLEAEAKGKLDFPGHTHALLTILLTWSHTTWALYHRLHDPKLFSIHPAFAYPVTPPVKKRLLSVGFYDTSVEPHKEIRFLGPGDVEEMSYHEVDVFDDPKSKMHNSASSRCNSPVGALKQTFRLTEKEASKHIRYMSMSEREKTGEGRWCYVLIKGNTPLDGNTPPHFMLAWHISTVTSTSDCLHTIYTDGPGPRKTPTQSQNKMKRFSSLQNLSLALRSPAKSNFHQSLRTASNSSGLPPINPYTTTQQREGATLHRTVLKMEKAGKVPLIEGYKVDVAAFRDWMEGCGRGEGKVIMWREQDSA